MENVEIKLYRVLIIDHPGDPIEEWVAAANDTIATAMAGGLPKTHGKDFTVELWYKVPEECLPC